MSNTPETLTEAEARSVVDEAITKSSTREERIPISEVEDRLDAVGVPRGYATEILKEWERREQSRRERNKKIRRALRDWSSRLGTFAFTLALLLGILFAIMKLKVNDVEESRELVFAAIGRQQTVLAAVRNDTDPLNRDAEIAGSTNRLYVAKANYDHSVAQYNALAGYMAWFLRRVPLLPTRLPLSREVWR